MKSLNLFLFYALLVFGFLSCNSGKENSNNQDLSNNPGLSQDIPADFKNQEYSIPVELEYGRIGKEFLYDRFYPIGWSQNGKFAYIVEPADEGSGFYWFEIVILDIVNNKLVWSWKPKESAQGDLQSTWKENYDLFRNQLALNEIVQQKSFELLPTKTSYKDNDFELVLEAKNVSDPDFGFDVIKEIDIRILSAQLGRKLVVNQKEDEYSSVIGAIIPGFLLSPFDDRIVVICKKDRIGYEGPPNVVYFELFGSDLARGFKKENKS